MSLILLGLDTKSCFVSNRFNCFINSPFGGGRGCRNKRLLILVSDFDAADSLEAVRKFDGTGFAGHSVKTT